MFESTLVYSNFKRNGKAQIKSKREQFPLRQIDNCHIDSWTLDGPVCLPRWPRWISRALSSLPQHATCCSSAWRWRGSPRAHKGWTVLPLSHRRRDQSDTRAQTRGECDRGRIRIPEPWHHSPTGRPRRGGRGGRQPFTARRSGATPGGGHADVSDARGHDSGARETKLAAHLGCRSHLWKMQTSSPSSSSGKTPVVSGAARRSVRIPRKSPSPSAGHGARARDRMSPIWNIDNSNWVDNITLIDRVFRWAHAARAPWPFIESCNS